jgi:hypothetical protein
MERRKIGSSLWLMLRHQPPLPKTLRETFAYDAIGNLVSQAKWHSIVVVECVWQGAPSHQRRFKCRESGSSRVNGRFELASESSIDDAILVSFLEPSGETRNPDAGVSHFNLFGKVWLNEKNNKYKNNF